MTSTNFSPVRHDVTNVFSELLLNSMKFNLQLWNSFAEAYPIYLSTVSEYNKSWKDLSELDRVLRRKFRKTLDEKFRQKSFVNSLSDNVASYSRLANILGLGNVYRSISNGSSIWNNEFIEPIRDTLYRTPSYKVWELENYSLFRYGNLGASCALKLNYK
jgi:polyhydroxyalkanoate synthase subunit PhaC